MYRYLLMPSCSVERVGEEEKGGEVGLSPLWELKEILSRLGKNDLGNGINPCCLPSCWHSLRSGAPKASRAMRAFH